MEKNTLYELVKSANEEEKYGNNPAAALLIDKYMKIGINFSSS
jgi:hypothetical protein